MAEEIQRLKHAIATNTAVIIVGPDVSNYTADVQPEVSFWQRFLSYGLERCRQLGKINDEHCEMLGQLLDQEAAEGVDYVLVADQIKYCLNENRDAYQSWLTDALAQFSLQKPELIKAIEELNCPMVTTNYDLLLEETLNKQPLTWNEYQNEEAMRNMKQFILHTHGHYKDPDSIVLDSGGYYQLSHNEFAQSQLETLMRNKTVLLIGYGSSACDLNLANLLPLIDSATSASPSTIYKLVKSGVRCSLLENIQEIPYGETFADLLFFISSLQSFSNFIRENSTFIQRREHVRVKYLNYLIEEYGHVSIFGYSSNDMSLPLESVYVELKFDPTHPSIRAMKSVDINEEFKRRVSSPRFFDANEKRKLTQAIIERQVFNPQTVYRDLMIDQWLNVLLSNRKIFSEGEAATIKRKVSWLKQSIFEKNNLTEARQYQIRQAYNEFKHFLILGHPGAGKTTLSKWLVMNMAQQCLGRQNMLFDKVWSVKEKIPILIPIWKYVDQSRDNAHEQKVTLLEFLHEHATLDSSRFTDEERQDLSALIMESLLHGHVLVVFEGLDEVPEHVDRADLVKDINSLLERSIDYDPTSDKLVHSPYEHKEINNTRDPASGNRFILTSRIEGNYFEEINFYIPRLTIQDMSNEALKLFCNSYTQCIKAGSRPDQLYNQIALNKDIFQLAINPQLASVIAAVYNQYEDRLPEKRIDLYEQAIGKMIERLATSSMHEQLRLTATMLWSILQNIAEYLHSRVEGLSESSLREIIRQSLNSAQQHSSTNADDLIVKLVDIFKYKVGLLNEFGYNSFRFIHRTFQEYLAAKSLIYFNGMERSADAIHANIISKIAVPNWRVPLSMTFGILSQLPEQDRLFKDILSRLLVNQSNASSEQFSTLLVPFVLIDSLTDMHFARQEQEHQLIHKLANMLLADYKNRSGFARLLDHQKLIHSSFVKLNKKSIVALIWWFVEKTNDAENIAPCANILHQLKWYCPKFHQIFLRNLHHDSCLWDWPVDSLLRFYSTKIQDPAVPTQLHFKRALIEKPELIEYIRKHTDWLAVITALYGGYADYRSAASIAEYYETAQFLQLSDSERMPFIFYYQDIWGRDDPAYNMAVHLDTFQAKENWGKAVIFDANEIHKESFLTPKILELLSTHKPATDLTEELRQHMSSATLDSHWKAEAAVASIALGDGQFVSAMTKDNQQVFSKSLQTRFEQLLGILQDPIARCSSKASAYLLAMINQMQRNPMDYRLKAGDYCRIYLSLIAHSGGLSVETNPLAEVMDTIEDKSEMYGEYFALKLTGGVSDTDIDHTVRLLFDQHISLLKSDLIIGSFLKMSNAVQLYQPVRLYPWPMDRFLFKSVLENDIPIAFFNCLENMHTNIAFAIGSICDIFIKEGYFDRNADLTPLIVLLVFGITSKDLDKAVIYEQLLPELTEGTHVRQILLERIRTMGSPYYKSRALYQLAQFDDQRSMQLLHESFQLTKDIRDASLRFQVLEKIYTVVHYKDAKERVLIERVMNELVSTVRQITDLDDRAIASIRLSFYGSGQFRKKYLMHTIDVLAEMEESNDKIQLMIKLKPLVSVYYDLKTKLDEMTRGLNNETNSQLVRGHYGKILCAKKPLAHESAGPSEYAELETLFRLVAQLNDAKLLTGQDASLSQLWTNLYVDVHNQSNMEKILRSALSTEIFLTPQVAIVIDELIQHGEEDTIAVLFPYIIKPSNEVLPIVHRWFTKHPHSKIKQLAALLLAEAKYLFEGAMETMIELLQDDRDQMRYRAQRIFQHPEREPRIPSKRTSIIGEKTLMSVWRILPTTEYSPRVRAYLRSYFYDLLWDDCDVFEHLRAGVAALQETNPMSESNIWYFNKIRFATAATWKAIMQSLQAPCHPLYVEDLLHATMTLVVNEQITENDWNEFAVVLAISDVSQFRERLYFSRPDLEIINLILDEICASTNLNDESYFANLQSKLVSEVTVPVDDLCHADYERIKHICKCSFYVSSKDLHQQIVDILTNISITPSIMDNLLRWLMQEMRNFTGSTCSLHSMVMCDHIASLMAACVQKEDYLYRKVTNSPKFDQSQLIHLLDKMAHSHPFFPARGSAFILLAALDLPDHQVIISALSTLFDENLVKEYAMTGIPLIHLSPNRLVDDLLKSLTNESAIKVHEVLKIVTQFALDEKIDANCKSQIIRYIAEEIGQFKSKKLVNYYHTDIKIPFTITLENDLYQTWIKIQGLAGKTLYAITEHQ